VVVSPAAEHLAELVAAHRLLTVQKDKHEQIARTLGGFFTVVRTRVDRRRLTLSGDQVRTLIAMTPSARHVSPRDIEGGTVTAAVDVTLFRRRDRPLPSPADDHGTDR
jgi:23S rRNA (guanine745-N1)-methyltransferase